MGAAREARGCMSAVAECTDPNLLPAPPSYQPSLPPPPCPRLVSRLPQSRFPEAEGGARKVGVDCEREAIAAPIMPRFLRPPPSLVPPSPLVAVWRPARLQAQLLPSRRRRPRGPIPQALPVV